MLENGLWGASSQRRAELVEQPEVNGHLGLFAFKSGERIETEILWKLWTDKSAKDIYWSTEHRNHLYESVARFKKFNPHLPRPLFPEVPFHEIAAKVIAYTEDKVLHS